MRKPSKKVIADATKLLRYVSFEGQRIADAMDPKREGQGEDATGLLAIITGLYTKASYGLHLPVFTGDMTMKKTAL